MSTDNFRAGLAEILGVKENEATDTLALNNDNWNSVEHLAAIALIDESFGVNLPAEDLTACTSVKALMDLIKRQVSAGVTSSG